MKKIEDQGAGAAGNLARNPAPAELPAGRELDALVAEHVMGFRWVTDWPHIVGLVLVTPDGETLAAWRRDDGGITAHLDRVVREPELPHYSTDIAAAWQVVEDAAARGWKVDVQNRASGWACIVIPPAAPQSYRECAETAPLAICRAALRAVSPNDSEATPHA